MTNGSLLYRKDVRQDLESADIVMPSLDASNEGAFLALNRPHPGLDFQKVMEGLADFSKDHPGSVWLEIMLVRGLNDTKEALEGIQRVVARVRPERVFLLTPIRPPAEAWVEIPDPATLLYAQGMIEGAELIHELETGHFDLNGLSSTRRAILDVGSRHPLRRDQALQIEAALHSPGAVQWMLHAGELIEVEYNGRSYLLPSRFRRGSSRNRHPTSIEHQDSQPDVPRPVGDESGAEAPGIAKKA
jgi:wyosine [tRNA(Phe)-imidazoG37] synthetase (radical SAM superfamily)